MPDLNTSQQRRIAMLIDGDNAQPSLMDKMIAETNKYGVITIRRIYGDWTENSMNSWKQLLHTHAIQPIQQFRNTIGKNATDSALIIDAMDILYTAGVDGVCLVSSDSDYTKLATRLREKNLFVMGIGKQTTPRAFVNACDMFVYTENLVTTPSVAPAQPRKRAVDLRLGQKAAPEPPPDPDTENIPPDLTTLFKTAFELAVGDDGWARLSSLGDRLRKLDPGFDPRTYGHKQLLMLVKAHPETFELRQRKQKNNSTSGAIYVRLVGDK